MLHIPVTVVIPCYNCAYTIDYTVQSVINQTLLPNELILVDDGSSDNGKTLTQLYKLKDRFEDRIAIIVCPLSKNMGAGGARNAGWDIATQPYIAFLDADDIWHKQKLELQYFNMQDNLDCAFCVHKHISILNETDLDQYTFISQKSWTQMNKWKNLFFTQVSTPSVMLKRNIKFRFKSGKRYSEDFFLWLQILFNGSLCMYIDYPLSASLKPLFGERGLSAQLWRMEKGELNTYYDLWKMGYISLPIFIIVYAFSFVKYLRREIIVFKRKFLANCNCKLRGER